MQVSRQRGPLDLLVAISVHLDRAIVWSPKRSRRRRQVRCESSRQSLAGRRAIDRTAGPVQPTTRAEASALLLARDPSAQQPSADERLEEIGRIDQRSVREDLEPVLNAIPFHRQDERDQARRQLVVDVPLRRFRRP
jgi:hypothetical protein